MNNLLKTLFFLLSLSAATMSVAQTCPSNITFLNQVDIDNFATTYPGCTQISGDLKIKGTAITNLNGLSMITSVGSLYISTTSNLTSLTGLASLKTIDIHLTINNNTKLTNLSGLSNLESVGGNIVIERNTLLVNFMGLSGLKNCSPDAYFTINANPKLVDLSGLTGLTNFPGNLAITMNPSLLNLSGLSNLNAVGGSFNIENNYKLTALTGLSGLQSVGGPLYIAFDTSLTDVSALSSLQTVGLSIGGGLNFTGNKKLASLNGLNSVTAVNGIHLGDNIKLTDINALDHPITIGNLGLNIDGNTLLSNCAVMAVCNYLNSFTPCQQAQIGIQNNNTCCRNCDEVMDVCAGNCCAPKVTITGLNCITTATTTLTADAGKGTFTYLWNTSPPKTTQKITVGIGTYCVTVTNVSGACTATACYTLCKVPTIAISPITTTTLCPGDCITLKALAGDNVTYAWSDGETKPERIVCPAGASTTYTVTATNGANCSATSSVIIKTVPCVNSNGCAPPH